MTSERRSTRDLRRALDQRLAALAGWFEQAPLPQSLTSLLEQLDAAPRETEPQDA